MKKITVMCCTLACLLACTTEKAKQEKVETESAPSTSLCGEWAEATAERIVATITPGDSSTYRVVIGWREEGLAQYEDWTMTLTEESDDTLVYSDGTYVVRQYLHEGDAEAQADTIYTNGVGKFYLNADGLLVWEDKQVPDQEPTLFKRAEFTEEQ